MADETKSKPELKPEITLYLQAQKLEQDKRVTMAAQKYQEALNRSPTFVLAQRRLTTLASMILPDHRKILGVDPGYTVKPSASDPRSIRGPVRIRDIMPGYLMVYKDPTVGEYALFSLDSRHMHNIHYLFVKEDAAWQQYPSITLPGVTRVNDILVYHQPDEAIQEGFINILINAFLSNRNH